MKMIKNVVLDFGGILTGLDKERCVKALRQIGAGRIAFYVDECKQEDLFHTLEMGLCTIHEFCDEARRKCSYTDENGTYHPCNATDEQLIWAWNELLLGVSQQKLNYIKRLRDCGRYNVVLLSNTNEVHWDYSKDRFFTCANGEEGLVLSDFFHNIFLSYELHVIKPDARIFQTMLSETGYEAGETIFVDDSMKNCEGANAVGIETIHDPTYTAWMRLLDERLGEHFCDETEYYAATIGNFDGVHLGHRHVISELLRTAADSQTAREYGQLRTMTVTLDRHPNVLFKPDFIPITLTTIEERKHLIAECGVDRCEVMRFDEAFASMTAHEFMQKLHDEYNVRLLLIGYDNHFGKRNQSEGFSDYVAYGKEIGIEVIGCDVFRLSDGSVVSSSRIREMLKGGETEAAKYLLTGEEVS